MTRLLRGIERFSRRAIAALLADHRENHQVRRAGIVVASLTDPATIVNQHMRAHANEGRLFRTVLIDALEQCGVTVRVVLERASTTFWAKPPPIGAAVEAPGRQPRRGHGRWRAEQKVAAAAAWPFGRLMAFRRNSTSCTP